MFLEESSRSVGHTIILIKKNYNNMSFLPDDANPYIGEKMNNYIIIHGSFGSKEENWFSWLKEELELNRKQVVSPQMPIGVKNQNFENWTNALNELDINENTIIIVHSTNPMFVNT